MPKRGHLWQIWWKDKSRLTKQLFCLSSWIIFDFKIKISGKNCVEKHPHIIVFMFGSKTNEFGRKNSESDEKVQRGKKPFCPFDLFCQTKFWKKNRKKADKKRQRMNDFAFLLFTTRKYSCFNPPYFPKRTLKFFLNSIPACSVQPAPDWSIRNRFF